MVFVSSSAEIQFLSAYIAGEFEESQKKVKKENQRIRNVLRVKSSQNRPFEAHNQFIQRLSFQESSDGSLYKSNEKYLLMLSQIRDKK